MYLNLFKYDFKKGLSFIYLGILSFIRIYFLYFQDSFPSKMKALYSAMGIAILFITLLFSVVMGLIAVAQ